MREADLQKTKTMNIGKLLLAGLIAGTTAAQAQNLVPNPGFETLVACPENYFEEAALAQGWSSYNGTSDFRHACAGTLPNVMPHSGDGFIGMITYIDYDQNYREHIGIELTNDLVIGQEYDVSLYVMKRSGSWTGASNNMGIRFTTGSPADYPSLTNSAHVYSDVVITDTANWTQISGSFVADSAYRYLMVGNFFDSTHTVRTGDAYYYVDDIYVSTHATTALNEFLLISAGVHPNPAGANATITFDNPANERFSLALYDVHGRQVTLLNDLSGDSVTLDREPCKKGIYFFELRTASGRSANGKILFE